MLGKPGKPANPQTVRRWVREGVRVGSESIRLRGHRRPHGLAFRHADVVEFYNRLQVDTEALQSDDSRTDLSGETLVGEYPA